MIQDYYSDQSYPESETEHCPDLNSQHEFQSETEVTQRFDSNEARETAFTTDRTTKAAVQGIEVEDDQVVVEVGDEVDQNAYLAAGTPADEIYGLSHMESPYIDTYKLNPSTVYTNLEKTTSEIIPQQTIEKT